MLGRRQRPRESSVAGPSGATIKTLFFSLPPRPPPPPAPGAVNPRPCLRLGVGAGSAGAVLPPEHLVLRMWLFALWLGAHLKDATGPPGPANTAPNIEVRTTVLSAENEDPACPAGPSGKDRWGEGGGGREHSAPRGEQAVPREPPTASSNSERKRGTETRSRSVATKGLAFVVELRSHWGRTAPLVKLIKHLKRKYRSLASSSPREGGYFPRHVYEAVITPRSKPGKERNWKSTD